MQKPVFLRFLLCGLKFAAILRGTEPAEGLLGAALVAAGNILLNIVQTVPFTMPLSNVCLNHPESRTVWIRLCTLLVLKGIPLGS